MDEKTVTEPRPEDDEISLIDLVAVLLHYKWMICIVTVLGAVASVVVAIASLKLPVEKSFMPNVYTSSAHMLITDSSSSSGLSSMLASSGETSFSFMRFCRVRTSTALPSPSEELANADR